MWRIVLFSFLLSGVNSCAVRTEKYGKICVCNATYCDSAPKVEKLVAGQLQIIFTTSTVPGFNVKRAKFTNLEVDDSAVIVEVNSKKTHQKIVGFGGTFTDSTGINIGSLPVAAQKNLMEAYFGEYGLEYTLCKVPMGATEFSPRAYTHDDNHDDVGLKKFSLQKEDLEYKIPYIQQAQALAKGKTKFFTSSWTAPLWMKIHEVWAGYAPLQKKYYQTWTDYAIKFLDEFAKHNITYWGITTGSEIVHGFDRIPKPILGPMAFTPLELNVWLRDNLGPTLRKSPYKDIKILAMDDTVKAIPWYMPVIFGDNKTLPYLDGVAVHWYYDQRIHPDVNYMAKTDKKELLLLMTELSFAETLPFLGSWNRAIIVADSIIEHMLYDYNGYTDWNMALDMEGKPSLQYTADAAIIVNKEKKEFYKQPYFYVMGHFSKYVKPDSVRIDSKLISTNETDIEVVAFQRPDKLNVVILLNRAFSHEKIQIRDNGKLSEVISLPARSIQTILYA